MSSYRYCVGSRNRSWGSSGSEWGSTGEASLQRPRGTPCRGKMRPGHTEPHRRPGHGAAGGGAPAIVNSVESEEAIGARLPPRGECREPGGAHPRRAPGGSKALVTPASGGGHSIGHGPGSCLGWLERRRSAP
jgi:hypothetical protein